VAGDAPDRYHATTAGASWARIHTWDGKAWKFTLTGFAGLREQIIKPLVKAKPLPNMHQCLTQRTPADRQSDSSVTAPPLSGNGLPILVLRAVPELSSKNLWMHKK
jgi:hypothetical protein